MIQEGLWSLLLLIVLVTAFAIVFKLERVKRLFFYGVITCLTLALLFMFVGRESYWFTAFGFFLSLIFALSIPYILSSGTISGKKSLLDATTPKSSKLSNRYRWITKLLVLPSKYPRTIKVLRWLVLGFVPVFPIVGLTATISGGMLDESHFVRPEDQVLTEPNFVAPGYPGCLTRYAVVGLSVVVGIVTLIVTFIFGLFFGSFFIEDSRPIGLSTGLWVGLLVIWALITEPVSTRLYIAATCVLCGYLGGNLSLRVRNILGRLTGK